MSPQRGSHIKNIHSNLMASKFSFWDGRWLSPFGFAISNYFVFICYKIIKFLLQDLSFKVSGLLLFTVVHPSINNYGAREGVINDHDLILITPLGKLINGHW